LFNFASTEVTRKTASARSALAQGPVTPPRQGKAQL